MVRKLVWVFAFICNAVALLIVGLGFQALFKTFTDTSQSLSSIGMSMMTTAMFLGFAAALAIVATAFAICVDKLTQV